MESLTLVHVMNCSHSPWSSVWMNDVRASSEWSWFAALNDFLQNDEKITVHSRILPEASSEQRSRSDRKSMPKIIYWLHSYAWYFCFITSREFDISTNCINEFMHDAQRYGTGLNGWFTSCRSMTLQLVWLLVMIFCCLAQCLLIILNVEHVRVYSIHGAHSDQLSGLNTFK